MRIQLPCAYTSATEPSAWGVASASGAANLRKLRLHRTARRCSCSTPETFAPEQLLDRYWQARGVSNSEHRRRLVDCATSSETVADAGKVWDTSAPLPGVNAYWQLDDEASSAPLVRAVSERLLSLHNLLGRRDDVDVVQMLLREPRLLSVSLSSVATRLIIMRGAAGAETMDIGRVCEAQPSLLLHDSSMEDTPEAWSYGLASDNIHEWTARLEELSYYVNQWGDAHVGFRHSDDPELVRWARMQRSSFAEGSLTEARTRALQELGFVFDAEEAEWDRWFNQLMLVDPTKPLPLASGDDFLLINWCSVQRIANRAGVLSKSRQVLLDSLAFDWTGADALS